MTSDNIQGGYGLSFKLNGTAIVGVTDIDEVRFARTFRDITGHDSPDGYKEVEPDGRYRLEPFVCSVMWDAAEATHEAVVSAFDNHAPSDFQWADPNAFETIDMKAQVEAISRISQQEDKYYADVLIHPVRQPTVTPAYYQRVLATEPSDLIAYWPLWDASGSEAEQIAPGSIPNGSITGCLLGQPGIGDGKKSMYFDGSGDHIDIWSTALETALATWVTGSAMIWVKPDTGYWLANYREHIYIDGDQGVPERFRLQQGFAVDRLYWIRVPGGSLTTTGNTDTDWFLMSIAWDATSTIAYKNGSQAGTPAAGATAWTDNGLPSARIGSNGSNGSVMLGWLAHAVLWDGVKLTAAQMLELATV